MHPMLNKQYISLIWGIKGLFFVYITKDKVTTYSGIMPDLRAHELQQQGFTNGDIIELIPCAHAESNVFEQMILN